MRAQPFAHPLERALAPDQGGGYRRQVAGPRPVGLDRGVRPPGAGAQDLLVQRGRLRIRRRPELAAQHVGARLVLAQGGLTAPGPGVEAHEGAVRGLLPRVEGEQPEPGLHRGGGRVGLLLLGEQSAEALDRQRVQPLALAAQPVLEGGLAEAHPGEEIAPVQGDDLRERGGPAVGEHRLEPRHVHVHRGGVERHVRPVEPGAAPGRGGQRLADARQRVAQVAPRLRRGHVAPQQRGQLVARVGPPERQRQVGQERLGLADGERERRSLRKLGPESSEQGEPQPRVEDHDSQASIFLTGRVRCMERRAAATALARSRGRPPVPGGTLPDDRPRSERDGDQFFQPPPLTSQ